MRGVVDLHRPDLVELVREEVGEDVFERADQSTAFAQPAIFCAALAGWEVLRQKLEPSAMAGHSLGEIAALAAGGALKDAEALRLVALRGRLMAEAAGGGMLAVRADDRALLARVIFRWDLTLANDNAPRQQVLSGAVDKLESAAEELRSCGVAARRLPVAGAFHSPLMEPAVAPFRKALAEITFTDARVPVLSGVTAEPFDDMRERLAQAIVRPVAWMAVMRALSARGITRFVETGPGRILTGLVRKSLSDVEAEAPLALESFGA